MRKLKSSDCLDRQVTLSISSPVAFWWLIKNTFGWFQSILWFGHRIWFCYKQLKNIRQRSTQKNLYLEFSWVPPGQDRTLMAEKSPPSTQTQGAGDHKNILNKSFVGSLPGETASAHRSWFGKPSQDRSRRWRWWSRCPPSPPRSCSPAQTAEWWPTRVFKDTFHWKRENKGIGAHEIALVLTLHCGNAQHHRHMRPGWNKGRWNMFNLCQQIFVVRDYPLQIFVNIHKMKYCESLFVKNSPQDEMSWIFVTGRVRS